MKSGRLLPAIFPVVLLVSAPVAAQVQSDAPLIGAEGVAENNWTISSRPDLLLAIQENTPGQTSTSILFNKVTYPNIFLLSEACLQLLDTADSDSMKSLECFRAGLSQDPLFFPFLHNAGILSYRNRLEKEGVLYLRKALAIFPESWITELALSRAFRKQGNLIGAGEALKRAAKMHPFDPQIPTDQGELFLEKESPDLALPYFERALGLDPHLWQAKAGMARCLILLGKKTQAQKLLAPDPAGTPPTGRALYYRALIYEAMGNPSQAGEALDRLLERSEDPFFQSISREEILRRKKLLEKIKTRFPFSSPAVLQVEPL